MPPRGPPAQLGRYEDPEAPEQERGPPSWPARSLRTQQRAYDPAPRTDPVPHTAPRKGDGAVLGAGPTPAAELVSVPPSSTTPDTRGPPQSAIRHGLGAALHHRASLGGECSLERR
jgi:hypothetical protein